MTRGGKTSTTWATGSSWQSGQTKVIRVPEILADHIMSFARALDSGEAELQGITADDVLAVIDIYISIRRAGRHANQHSDGSELNLNARTWDELRKLQKLLASNPEKLGLKSAQHGANLHHPSSNSDFAAPTVTEA